MPEESIHAEIAALHRARFGVEPAHIAYAPGRVEILGNHTDYNGGAVLSASVDLGTFCAISPSNGPCCVYSANLDQETAFDPQNPTRDPAGSWTNYVKGVISGVSEFCPAPTPFVATIQSSVPVGAGLSSSAALEVSLALAFSTLCMCPIAHMDVARLCQKAEEGFAGTSCGLLDQITALFGKFGALVWTDFRTLEIRHVNFPRIGKLLVCDSGIHRHLTASEYNLRRAQCEEAAAILRERIGPRIRTLGDVSIEDWRKHAGGMDPLLARRSAHIIGENERVSLAAAYLDGGRPGYFGELMFRSHQSSRENFQNSCAELDFLVDCAREIDGVLGARLTGGGFGGSVVALVDAQAADDAAAAIDKAFRGRYGRSCSPRIVQTGDGARVLET